MVMLVLYVKTIESFDSLETNQRCAEQHLAGIELLKYALFEEYGLEIDEADILRSEHGKPYVNKEDVNFSISHSGNKAAVFTASRPCGVDIEKIRPVNRSVISRVCTEREIEFIGDSPRRFITLWTLKESYVKAVGRGLGFGLKNIEFEINNDGIRSNLGGEFGITELDGFIVAYCLKS